MLSIAKQFAEIVHAHNFWATRDFSFSVNEKLGIFTTTTTIIPEHLFINIKGMPVMSAVIGLSNQINESPNKKCRCFIVGAVGSQQLSIRIHGGDRAKVYKDTINLPKDKIGAYVFFILFPIGKPGLKKERLLSSKITNLDTNPELIIRTSRLVPMQ